MERFILFKRNKLKKLNALHKTMLKNGKRKH